MLVTGADGFVGSWLVPRLLSHGHEVLAGVRPGSDVPAGGTRRPLPAEAEHVPFELADDRAIAAVAARDPDGVIHLAAVASGGEASRDPATAWEVNAVGTARLAEALARRRAAGRTDPRLVLVSTAEVYGAGVPQLRTENDPTVPCSPYAASKLGAEVAALEVGRRTGLAVIVARPFAHTGRGQDDRFVAPAFARRLHEAKRTGACTIRVGNLEPVREFMHVSDVAEAYMLLLAHGEGGAVYNVASGIGITLRELVVRLAAHVGHPAEPVPDPALVRAADIPHLVGEAARLRTCTGWRPRIGLDETLAEVADAQAH